MAVRSCAQLSVVISPVRRLPRPRTHQPAARRQASTEPPPFGVFAGVAGGLRRLPPLCQLVRYASDE